jgi:hypothetical protein
MSVQQWAEKQVGSLSRVEFDDTFDQWFRGEIRLQDLFDFTLSKEQRRELSRAMNARNVSEE